MAGVALRCDVARPLLGRVAQEGPVVVFSMIQRGTPGVHAREEAFLKIGVTRREGADQPGDGDLGRVAHEQVDVIALAVAAHEGVFLLRGGVVSPAPSARMPWLSYAEPRERVYRPGELAGLPAR
jgi:hypothetical protein